MSGVTLRQATGPAFSRILAIGGVRGENVVVAHVLGSVVAPAGSRTIVVSA